MPWSPLYYTKQVFERLKEWGQTKKTTSNLLEKAIMLETKMVRPKTIARFIKILEELGYIEKANDGWKIKFWSKEGNLSD